MRVNDAAHVGFELLPHGVQQVRKILIIRGLFYAHSADVRVTKFRKEGFDVLVFWQSTIMPDSFPGWAVAAGEYA